MLSALNSDEDKKKSALGLLSGDDSHRDEILRKFVALASQVLGIPGSFVSVLDDEFQHIKASKNFDLRKSTLEDAFCRHTVAKGMVLVCPDTLLDPRFRNNPLTTGAPYIRFYAGAPLVTRDAVIIGTLCVTDTAPHAFDTAQEQTLQLLASVVTGYLEAWHSAGYVDVVTHLPNRQRLVRDVERLSGKPHDNSYRIILIDCIDMPRAYDMARSLGIAAVETLLRDMAVLLRLRLKLNTTDVLYTVATGRFALLTPDDGRFTAENLNHRLHGISVQIMDNITIDLQVSTGDVSFFPGAATVSATETLRKAISALHEAIAAGTGSMSYDETNDFRRSSDFSLRNDLAGALEGNEGLYLVYQPKISLKTGKPVGLEALIRWKHPVRGELSPAEFVHLAEATSLMGRLTDWVIDAVVRQLKAWSKTCFALPVSVNVSVSDISRPRFADRLEDKLLAHGLHTESLGIECLETEKILESPQAMEGLDMLKLRGFTISIDDFGSGYSNINYLHSIPMDVIKLDRSLISRICTDTASRIIARHVISLLKELDYVVLAEGVEDESTAVSLKALGCDEAQGFYYSRPLPVPLIDNWLQWQLRDNCV
ncbi:sensor domain-containing phosphodiesterase (plasmid) [Erwinia rhapontici]|uniref:sensor domain-containing phosphodiesterase n=1 Tax=Erwinia rhapontici TaxID=55212 RepID=UPI001BB3516C|nr:GGDEF and EAL domain-containing protein [Erwinia rhapontici]BCQ42422.1 sensor domain-containing phosphodiesterase [Erwinia rhapontici]